jgi:hypothetical protein
MNYKLTFQESEFGPATECEFSSFSPEDQQVLTDFMTFSDEAHRTRFANEIPSYKISFFFSNSGIVRNDGKIPDKEALSTFLHKYRPILLKSEKTEFTHVCSIVLKHINHPNLKKLARQWRAQYSGKMIREIATISQDDMSLISQTFLENYLNAFEYHRDSKLRKKLDGFTQKFEPDAQVGLVTLLLIMKFTAVSELRGFIRKILELTNFEIG